MQLEVLLVESLSGTTISTCDVHLSSPESIIYILFRRHITIPSEVSDLKKYRIELIVPQQDSIAAKFSASVSVRQTCYPFTEAAYTRDISKSLNYQHAHENGLVFDPPPSSNRRSSLHDSSSIDRIIKIDFYNAKVEETSATVLLARVVFCLEGAVRDPPPAAALQEESENAYAEVPESPSSQRRMTRDSLRRRRSLRSSFASRSAGDEQPRRRTCGIFKRTVVYQEPSDELEISEFVVEPGRSEVQAEARDLNPDDVLTRSKKVQAERTKLDASEKEVLRELEELTGAQERENEKKRKRVDAYKAEIRRLKKLKTDSN